MTSHTPGPWAIEERQTAEGEAWVTVLRGAFDVSHNRAAAPGVVADARYSAMSDEENRANARLIAAAPDLLEALDRLTGEVRACWGMSGVREAIGNTNYDVVECLIDQSLDALERALGRRVHRYPAQGGDRMEVCPSCRLIFDERMVSNTVLGGEDFVACPLCTCREINARHGLPGDRLPGLKLARALVVEAAENLAERGLADQHPAAGVVRAALMMSTATAMLRRTGDGERSMEREERGTR